MRPNNTYICSVLYCFAALSYKFIKVHSNILFSMHPKMRVTAVLGKQRKKSLQCPSPSESEGVCFDRRWFVCLSVCDHDN